MIPQTLMEEQKQFELVLSPQATITSIITSIKEMMKEKHEVETVNCVKLIYRGFVMEPEKQLEDYNVNPEYVVLAIASSSVSQEIT